MAPNEAGIWAASGSRAIMAAAASVVVFLDVDGVVCLPRQGLQPDLLRHAARICTETNAEVVLSSTWRHQPRQIQRLAREMALVGLRTDFVLRTDSIPKEGFEEERAGEILAFVMTHSPVCWVVLDDLDLGPHLGEAAKEHFVCVDGRMGLTKQNADCAIKLLLQQKATLLPSPERTVGGSSFEAHVRASTASLGFCVLDVTAETARMYAQGSFELVVRDFRAVLGADIATRAEQVCVDRGVAAAFSARQEIINLKKVYLHVLTAMRQCEFELQRLATFYFREVERDETTGSTWRLSPRYVRVSRQLQLCRGELSALTDARDVTKGICMLPRHGDMPWVAKLAGAPATLRTASLVLSAKRLSSTTSAIPDEAADKTGPLLWGAGLSNVMQHMRGENWGDDVNRFIELSLVARGAGKALAMHREMLRMGEVIEGLLPLLHEAEASLHHPTAVPCATDPTEVAHAVKADAVLHQLQRARPLLSELSSCLNDIARRPTAKRFVAGDDVDEAGTLFVPPDFTAARSLAAHRAVIARHTTDMSEDIAREGWPSPHRPSVVGDRKCDRCSGSFGKLWAPRGVCMQCETAMRAARHCPFSTNCPPSNICPHSGRCFACEGWACPLCNLARGDGEDLLSTVTRLNPDILFLDFDRTLCSTRSGAKPVEGVHTLDTDLVALLSRAAAKGVVVTRNPHVDDIRRFVASAGAQDVAVYHVGKGQSKATVIQDESVWDGSGTAVFADDSIRELTDPQIASIPRLCRFLFVRGQ